MKNKTFALKIAGTIFGLVAILHLLRLITDVSVEIGGWLLPMWVNMLGLMVTIVLCFWLWLQAISKEK